MTHQLHAPALFGSSFGPPHIVATNEHFADGNRLRDDEIGSDR
jgi:hypothetical protein